MYLHVFSVHTPLILDAIFLQMLGVLNVHIWQAWCGSTIHDLRRNRFFPLYPDVRLTIKKFFLRHVQNDYGQRIFGYVHPPVSGNLTER